MECFGEILDIVRRKTPVVHSITNYVTVNDCANMILAAGGSPIMADDAAEVEQIVALSSALVINIGTLNARTVASMLAAGKRANALNIPVVLDPVGAGASDLRNETLRTLLREVRFADNGIRQGVGEWRLFQGEIEGYEHQRGIRNVLRLQRYPLASKGQPATDGPRHAYVLDLVVESERVR